MKYFILIAVAAIALLSIAPPADASTRGQRVAARNFNAGFRAGAAQANGLHSARANGFHANGFHANGFGVRGLSNPGCLNTFRFGPCR